ncbi:hypothetical protein CCR85_02230 [Rhodothalassium salexigens]|uniref:DUF2867 domain-containing protein n=1 Tax=Rhodothalassium salexigens TaxID=1086 RepID=UPI00191393C6|nr:DUF2867 domain-containing protein [Rhodothalassium salexigens]MBK5910307.1 hypothetical protein [Rhodothalassium salexigens]MBK5921080.1 hypothetical protein [Rhodothalassium salexigens]
MAQSTASRRPAATADRGKPLGKSGAKSRAQSRGNTRTALVFGASGTVGRFLVPRLVDEGYRVRAAARGRAKLAAEGWHDVDTVAADALRPWTLDAALDGVSVAFYLVHSMGVGASFPERDRRAARHFAAAAARAGVERIVYLGGVTPEGQGSAHLSSRVETGDILRDGPVPVVELRAPVIVGPGSVAFEVVRDLAAHLPAVVAPREVFSLSPPVAMADLVDDLVALAEAPEAAGQTYETGGPDRIGYDTMIAEMARALGRDEPRLFTSRLIPPDLAGLAMPVLTATPANVARALLSGMKYDFSADDRGLRDLVPREPRTFAEGVADALEAERRIVATDRFREGAFNLRGERHDIGFYAKTMTRAVETDATPAEVWQVVEALGTERAGYFFLSVGWQLRRQVDQALGNEPAGPRAAPGPFEPGERFDIFEVLAARAPDAGGGEPGRLTLFSDAIGPGRGGLEIEVRASEDGRTRLSAMLFWHPAGPAGLLYWYQLGPAHGVMLRGMVKAIAEYAAQGGWYEDPADAGLADDAVPGAAPT